MCLIVIMSNLKEMVVYVIQSNLPLFDVQEIKFEPSVMCEPIEKRCTFRASQVYVMHTKFVVSHTEFNRD